jgi:hypothetical protein
LGTKNKDDYGKRYRQVLISRNHGANNWNVTFSELHYSLIKGKKDSWRLKKTAKVGSDLDSLSLIISLKSCPIKS